MTQVGTSLYITGSGKMNQRKSQKKLLVNHESEAPIRGVKVAYRPARVATAKTGVGSVPSRSAQRRGLHEPRSGGARSAQAGA